MWSATPAGRPSVQNDVTGNSENSGGASASPRPLSARSRLNQSSLSTRTTAVQPQIRTKAIPTTVSPGDSCRKRAQCTVSTLYFQDPGSRSGSARLVATLNVSLLWVGQPSSANMLIAATFSAVSPGTPCGGTCASSCIRGKSDERDAAVAQMIHPFDWKWRVLQELGRWRL